MPLAGEDTAPGQRPRAATAPQIPPAAPAPFIELPLGATEDRVTGALDLEPALREGRRRLRPGLLSQADGGVLYVDEVNLLPDHLVDLLLDAAAGGCVRVERDGLSETAPARFILIGSMNPEEGELRPQFLDRFGLCVHVTTPADPALRAETIRRRLAYEAGPPAFAAAAEPAAQRLRARLAAARARLRALALDDATLAQAAALCARLKLDGARGDLALVRAARALAAWEDAPAVTAAHLSHAARFALPHRKRKKPFDPVKMDPLPDPLDAAAAHPRGQDQNTAAAPQPAHARPPHPAANTPPAGSGGPGAPPAGSSGTGDPPADGEAADIFGVRRVLAAFDGGIYPAARDLAALPPPCEDGAPPAPAALPPGSARVPRAGTGV
ncbi:MAG: ATP-binding protein, partial [Opitutaceae bacterium]|nr:ATP-binding protein [Opitutaceae bacterium]